MGNRESVAFIETIQWIVSLPSDFVALSTTAETIGDGVLRTPTAPLLKLTSHPI
ncbi:hypothetical protein [Streptococcus loxodontisalivarius]|uniref:Uncharacterized protein n=1 Tax=Streptococcus loxodontisalivarius TaxID=1349415 RepID=A0ABS2PRB1_9STRE|nr:hypothetical protein [Streptococcus loxodontisalivarius]MBM7642567.1 hypothetical protein [Streptococcus loxodontisalivarius]